MSYIVFKALVKKVNLKPKGVKEIVLEVSGSGLDGKLDRLSEMIDQYSEVQLESLIVNYNITINAKTNEPLKSYKVDQNGVVQEVKKENEQLEADFGLPKEKVETKEQKQEIDREPVDQFIIEGLAPNFDDFPDDFANIVKRRLDGESYSKLAGELNTSSGKIVDMIDEYRKRVAPLAQPWWERKQSKDDQISNEKEPKPDEIVTDKGDFDQLNKKNEQTDDEQNGAA
jgi:hypothetical protein